MGYRLEERMPTAKVAITVERELLRNVDRWVTQGRYPNRSRAIQAALMEKMERWRRSRLMEALEKIDPREERALAEERMAGDTWLES